MNRPDQQATPIPPATSPAKRGYIVALRCLRVVFRYLGILHLLERFKGNLAARYLRSLFAIYDPVDLMRLDIPWWTFAAIQEVEEMIASWEGEVRVFEYACGNSSYPLAAGERNVFRLGAAVSIRE